MESGRADGTVTSAAERERSVQSLADTLGGVLRPLLSPSGREIDVRAGTADRVRDVVCQFTCDWRAAGEPPEKVVVGVKTAVRLALREDAGQENIRQVTRRAVQWCIGAYYRDD
jgi:hypothetical protein